MLHDDIPYLSQMDATYNAWLMVSAPCVRSGDTVTPRAGLASPMLVMAYCTRSPLFDFFSTVMSIPVRSVSTTYRVRMAKLMSLMWPCVYKHASDLVRVNPTFSSDLVEPIQRAGDCDRPLKERSSFITMGTPFLSYVSRLGGVKTYCRCLPVDL